MAKQFTVFNFIRDIKEQSINMQINVQKNTILLLLLLFIMSWFACDYKRWHPHFDGSITDGQCISWFDSDRAEKYIETTMKVVREYPKWKDSDFTNTIDDSISVIVYKDGVFDKEGWEIIGDEYPPEKSLKE